MPLSPTSPSVFASFWAPAVAILIMVRWRPSVVLGCCSLVVKTNGSFFSCLYGHCTTFDKCLSCLFAHLWVGLLVHFGWVFWALHVCWRRLILCWRSSAHSVGCLFVQYFLCSAEAFQLMWCHTSVSAFVELRAGRALFRNSWIIYPSVSYFRVSSNSFWVSVLRDVSGLLGRVRVRLWSSMGGFPVPQPLLAEEASFRIFSKIFCQYLYVFGCMAEAA